MLTAAVRDLHLTYPNRFLTDVRTTCGELWENNPYVTSLSDGDSDVRSVECHYPLINRSNEAPYHCIHGFIEHLNETLGLKIRPTAFKGDIHISAAEKSWFSQVEELTGEETPFWIVAGGGKYDYTIKWWSAERYQRVIDHFQGKILFVQVGEIGHFHPRLKGVVDLRGKTSLRQLVRLVYHAQGVLCPVTGLMHLSAAVPVKDPRQVYRPCVVVAGGREPAHWEAYPNHQFIHTTAALPCCLEGGCWKSRTEPLGDGDEEDRHLCLDVVGHLPRCMDMISSDEVIRRIELYFQGGVAAYLTPGEHRGGKKAIALSTQASSFDSYLNRYTAAAKTDAFLETISPYPGHFRGRGIVICGGGLSYFTGAWVCIRMLKQLGCRLPIQVWHLGPGEFDAEMGRLLEGLEVECVDAMEVRKDHPVRLLQGWELKPYAILHSPFREVLLLDADNVPVRNPEYLFESAPYRETGAIFWPDYGKFKPSAAAWKIFDVPYRDEPDFESGQIVVDKERCWKALSLAMWYNENSDFYYQHVHGDKETFHLAFRKLSQPYSMPSRPIHPLTGTMCQHDFAGQRLFQHRNMDKWDLLRPNIRVTDFSYEENCFAYLNELRERWDGRCSLFRPRDEPGATQSAFRPPRIKAWMISCPERTAIRARTLEHLSRTDWPADAVAVRMDGTAMVSRKARQTETAFLALARAVEDEIDYLLFLEDDLEFNRFLRHNLDRWPPLLKREVTLAGLYNPGIVELAADCRAHAFIADPYSIFGSQAFLISAPAARFFLENWNTVDGMQDIKFSRLAAELKRPVFYHAPSLVQHVGRQSAWGGRFHEAFDYDPEWKAP